MSTATQSTVSKASLSMFLRLFKDSDLYVETCQGMILLSCVTDATELSNIKLATICIGDHEGDDVTFKVHHSDVSTYVRSAKPKDSIAFTVDATTRELIADCTSIGEMRWTIKPKKEGEYPTPQAVFDNLGEFKATISLADVRAAKEILDRCDLDATRYALSCIMFDGKTIVATDGRRMATMSAEGNYADAVMIESSLIEYAAKFGFEIDAFAKRTIAGDVVLSNHDGRYPNWRQVVPSDVTAACVWNGNDTRKQVDTYIAKQKAAKIDDAWGIDMAIGDGVKAVLHSRFVKAAIGDLASINVSYDTKAQGRAKRLKVPVVLTSDHRPGWAEIIMPMAPDRS